MITSKRDSAMKKRATPKEAITPVEYRAFQEAYDFFNAELFDGSLPHVLVTLQRHAKARAYFSPERFSGRNEAKVTAHELAMNPDSFTGRTDESILSTLAHEMAHVWQQTHGTPPRRSYHDRQWAAKMKEIGLQPSTTGGPGGKETGQSVTHYIIPEGLYAKAYARLKAKGFQLHWQSAPAGKQAKAKKASKTKFTCTECGQNAWAKRDSLLICGACYEVGEGYISLMLAALGEDAEAT
jgi:predicted SprT family Zn-dependent metalloprotease